MCVTHRYGGERIKSPNTAIGRREMTKKSREEGYDQNFGSRDKGFAYLLGDANFTENFNFSNKI